MRLSVFALTAALALPAAGAMAQSPPRALSLVPEAQFDLGRLSQAKDALVAVADDGHLIATTRYGGFDIVAFDATGKPLGWQLPTGRRNDSEILYPSRVGWLRGTTTAWVADFGFSQVALVDVRGKVFKSIEYFSWVHPTWAERRRYPVFASMEALAIYPDHSMLVAPGRERSLIDTPGFDRSVYHLLHVSPTGAIERTVATLPLRNAGGMLRAPECRNAGVMPGAAATEWSVASDGSRITFVAPTIAASDSGTFRVTSLNERGDTVFSRRYPQPAARNSQQSIDNFVSGLRGCGSMSAQVRDSAIKHIPEFKSFVTGVVTGTDGSAAVLMRTADDTSRMRVALVIDAKGEIVGAARFPLDQAIAAVSRDHLWITERVRNGAAWAIVRYRLDATTARPARTAPASTSSNPSRPPA